MAHVTCIIDGYPYELRFHIKNTLGGIPGESKKAREFRDALYTLQGLFASSNQLTNASTLPKAPLPVRADSDDIYEQIRKLALLRDDGIVMEQEFAQKKAELLSRL
jgi:hypothetical protein